MKKYTQMQKIRVKNGYTQKKLGQALGITKQYVWDIEDGRKTLSYKMAYRMSKVLETTPDELFLEDFKKEKEK